MAMEEWKVGVGGGGGVGLGMGGGMGLGEGGWSIAGRRGGMLLCWFSLDSEKEYFKVLLIYLGPFPFRGLTFFRYIFSFLKDGRGGGAAPGQGPTLDSSYAASFFLGWSGRPLRKVLPPPPPRFCEFGCVKECRDMIKKFWHKIGLLMVLLYMETLYHVIRTQLHMFGSG